MRIAAIIAEYDPFHHGHLYLVNKARRSGADHVIAIMSGSFMQRGGPAAFPVRLRTEMALCQGVDLVLEIPSYACCQSAEVFAQASVAILDSLGIIDELYFGCEDDSFELLDGIADMLVHETDPFKMALKQSLKEGLSFPAARSKALMTVMKDPAVSQILSRPNNILAIEYLKALKKTESRIRPVPVLRVGDAYHDIRISSEGPASATAIRTLLKHLKPEEIMTVEALPKSSRQLIAGHLACEGMITRSDFSEIAMYGLFQQQEHLEDYCDMTGSLSNRIRAMLPSYRNIEDFVMQVYSKNIAASAVWRSLFNVLLEHRKDIFDQWRDDHYQGYVNVLGLNKRILPLLSSVPEPVRKTMIIRPRDLDNLNETCAALAVSDQKADLLYSQMRMLRFGRAERKQYLKTIFYP